MLLLCYFRSVQLSDTIDQPPKDHSSQLPDTIDTIDQPPAKRAKKDHSTQVSDAIDTINQPSAKMMKQDHDTQLPDVIDQTAALNSFRCRHKHLLNLVSQTLTSLANSLLASSIIPEEVYQRVSNSNQAAFDRSVTLLDCIEARISSEPSDFKKVVQILQSDRFLQTLADGLVQSYCECVS